MIDKLLPMLSSQRIGSQLPRSDLSQVPLLGSVMPIALLLLVSVAGGSEPSGLAVQVGPQTIVFPDGYAGLQCFPDEPISILSTQPYRLLVVSGNSTVLMEGPGLESARPVRHVLEPGGKDSFDNGYVGIGAVFWSDRARRLLAFYHAEDHVGVPNKEYNTDLKGMYASIGLAVSNDGRTFSKVGQILTGNQPKQTTGDSAQGIGDVSVCPDHTGTYLYAYYTDWTRVGKRPVQIGLARSKIFDEGKPGSWYKYSRGGFAEPGLGGKDTPVLKGPTAFPCDAWAPHVTYLKTFKKYVMFFNVTAYSDQQDQKASKTGVYFACSDDGIEWSESQRVFAMHCIPYNDREIVMHPGFYVQWESDVKVTGRLIYGYSRRFGTAPPRESHHMAWRPVSISKLGETDRTGGTARVRPESKQTRPSGNDLSQALLGKWELDKQKENLVVQFRRDGTMAVTYAARGKTAAGSWRLEDRRVQFNVAGIDGVAPANKDWCEIVNITKDSMTVLMTGKDRQTWKRLK